MENVLVAKKNDTEKKNADKNKYLFEKCDGTDYAIAVTAGVIAGFVDVVFVGKPGESILGNQMDKAADKLEEICVSINNNLFKNCDTDSGEMYTTEYQEVGERRAKTIATESGNEEV